MAKHFPVQGARKVLFLKDIRYAYFVTFYCWNFRELFILFFNLNKMKSKELYSFHKLYSADRIHTVFLFSIAQRLFQWKNKTKRVTPNLTQDRGK
jgi:hypothetical protein